jgi:hypothetical protein
MASVVNCPMKYAGTQDTLDFSCDGAGCAWWTGKECAVKVLSSDITDIRKKVAGKKNK